MNSEELEKSLRLEFESYLKNVVANMRSEVDEFQIKIDAEFEKHKSLVGEAFQTFSSRFDSDHEFDGAFTEAVVEHLRLARDDGAKITAMAIAEAEEMERAAKPEVNYADIKEAINDISSKDSQSSILKALITHASNYTQRGAFFIIKNEHFVGWKVFGKEGDSGETAIRDIHFPLADDSILGKAVASLETVEGTFGSHPGDSTFLDPLQFGRPDRMYAIPLIARGRGVAVLYADYGTEGVSLNTDILETLVRVAGLTVELLASAKVIRSAPEASTDFSDAGHTEEFQYQPTSGYEFAGIEPVTTLPDYGSDNYDTEIPAYEPEPTIFTEPEPVAESTDFAFAETAPIGDQFQPESTFDVTPATEETASFEHAASDNPFASKTESEPTAESAVTDDYSSFDPHSISEPVAEPATDLESHTATVNPFEAAPFDPATDEVVSDLAVNGTGSQFEPFSPMESGSSVETPTPQPVRARLSDRQVDLPIEVADDERRLHNDARRFARLLVSEIKLYNEKKVQEGRESSDLYERLREAIDRSREMYDKRVQPAVAAKFDYFHYELVTSLAEGDEMRLGSIYAGAKV